VSALIIIWVSGMTLAWIALASFVSIMEEPWTTKLGLIPLALAAAIVWPMILLSVAIFYLERRQA
jgi:hypothetical protein